MKRLTLVSLLALAVLCACSSARYPEFRAVNSDEGVPISPFERAYTHGKASLSAGHDGLAIVAFQKALALKPASVAALNGIGAAYDGLRRYDLAQGYYRRALALEPTAADTLNNLAVSLALAGDPEAERVFAQASAFDPSNGVIRSNVSRLLNIATSEPTPLPVDDSASIDSRRPVVLVTGPARYDVLIPLHTPDLGSLTVGPDAVTVPAVWRTAIESRPLDPLPAADAGMIATSKAEPTAIPENGDGRPTRQRGVIGWLLFQLGI